MRIELISMKIDGFQGVRSFECRLDGADTVMKGENEVGKTRRLNAYLWCLTGKDSQGQTDSGKGHFDLRPHRRDGTPIEKLTVMVELELSFDGEVHTLRKEQVESRNKEGVIKGYPNQFYHNGSPVLKKDYDKFIQKYIDEDKFRILTDVFYFCGSMHWLKRRNTLAQFAEGVKPEGFDGLLERAEKRTLDEYKDALRFELKGNAQRDGLEEQLKKIPVQIEEVMRNLEHPDIDTTQLESQRAKLQAETAELRKQRQDLFSKETERQKKLEKINGLRKQQSKREGELENDNSAMAGLYEEKAALDKKIAEANQLIVSAENQKAIATAKKKATDNELAVLLGTLEDIRTEYNLVNEEKPTEVCYACSQKLPTNKLAENLTKKQERLDEINARGDKAKEQVTEKKKLLEAAEKNIQLYTEELEKAKAELKQAQEQADKRFTEIEQELKSRPKPDPKQDEAWQNLTAEIKKIGDELGPPVSEQLQAIESVRTSKDAELQKINEQLAQADRLKRDAERVKELEVREKELAQLVADANKELDLIKQYNYEYSKLVEEAVNDKFEFTEFKMFNRQVNGEIDSNVCEATNEGTSWNTMSKGQSIRVGADVINALSEEWGLSVPLFIDEAESLSHQINNDSQIIFLEQVKGVKTLQVNVIEKEEKAVA